MTGIGVCTDRVTAVGQVTPGTLWEERILREPLKSNTQVLGPFFLV